MNNLILWARKALMGLVQSESEIKTGFATIEVNHRFVLLKPITT
jgi:hypothetical protein